MRIWVQKSASMQKRTSPLKFGDLAEKSGLNSVSNLSIKRLLEGGGGAVHERVLGLKVYHVSFLDVDHVLLPRPGRLPEPELMSIWFLSDRINRI